MKNIGLILLVCAILTGCASTGQTPPPSPKVGENAPDFSLTDISGNEIRLSDFKEKQNVVLIFYTSYSYSNYNWPVCLDQLGELEKRSSEIKNLDSEIIAISSMGDQEDVKQVKRVYGITFPLIPKPNRKAAEDLGIWNRHKGYAMGTVIIDKKGRIRFRDVYDADDRYRTSAERIIRELQGI